MSANVRRNLAVQLTAGGTNPLKLRLKGSLPFKVGTAVSAALVAQGGTTPYAYSITAGALPTAASFTASVSTTVMTVTAVANGAITVGMPINGAGLAAGQTVVSFGTGVGGTGTYNLGISNTLGSRAMTGTLILAAATGLITGTASVAGPYTFTAQVQDALSTIFAGSFEMPVQHILVGNNVSPTPMENSVFPVSTPYSYTFTVANATGTVTWALTSGSLPPGLSLAAGGILSGTMTAASGSYTYTITATDSGTSDALPITLTSSVAASIQNSGIISTFSLIAGTYYPYIQPGILGGTNAPVEQFQTAGGYPPYKYSWGLPNPTTWAKLNTTTGYLYGTPLASDANKTFTINIVATDQIGAAISGQFTMKIRSPGIGGSVENTGLSAATFLGSQSNITSNDLFIPDNSSSSVIRKFTIASGKKLTIGSGAIFKIE